MKIKAKCKTNIGEFWCQFNIEKQRWEPSNGYVHPWWTGEPKPIKVEDIMEADLQADILGLVEVQVVA